MVGDDAMLIKELELTYYGCALVTDRTTNNVGEWPRSCVGEKL